MTDDVRLASIRLRDSAHTHNNLVPCDVAYLLDAYDELADATYWVTNYAPLGHHLAASDEEWRQILDRARTLAVRGPNPPQELRPTKPGAHP